MNDQFNEIKVRQLSVDEFPEVNLLDLVYVSADDEDESVLTAVIVTDPAGLGTEGGYAACRTIFGEDQQIHLSSPIYVEDPKGEVVSVIASAGAYIGLGLFFPGMDAKEVQERMFAALRKEFGSGLIQLWDEEALPVANVLYDVYETTQVSTGRGKTRETKNVRALRASGVYGPQAKKITPENNGYISIEPHQPTTHQAPTI